VVPMLAGSFGEGDYSYQGLRGLGAVYVVTKGDTLTKIAAVHGLTVPQLLAANPQIKNQNLIEIGQQITLPVTSVTMEAETVYAPPPSEKLATMQAQNKIIAGVALLGLGWLMLKRMK